MVADPADIARVDTPRGELALRRRGDGAIELRAAGLFVMDDRETSSERALAAAALDLLPNPTSLHVLVGGLGLGFTVRELLASPSVASIEVVEIEPELVAWLRSDLVPGSAEVLADSRVQVTVADLLEVFRARSAPEFDLILLDVDNGPDSLVHAANAHLYDTAGLRRAQRLLNSGGVLAIWSATPAASLQSAMQSVFGNARTVEVPVQLGNRSMAYWLLVAQAS